MPTLADSLRVGLQTGLIPAIISLWPDSGAAMAYGNDTVAPMVEGMGFHLAVASLNGKRQTPTQALLAGLRHETGVQRLRDGEALYDLLQEHMEARCHDGRPVVLLLTGMERWLVARWRNDVAAFRAFAQADQERLFVVYVCVEHEALRRLFLTRGEPLYREGMIVTVQADGAMV